MTPTVLWRAAPDWLRTLTVWAPAVALAAEATASPNGAALALIPAAALAGALTPKEAS